ncbi:phage major capsid protein [Natrononativus amylolyticus]|uniref:phage major capsid protein n=1 Tax=Natrononativus amylolyticus TaxID=2963434 RepID=UPI003CE54210
MSSITTDLSHVTEKNALTTDDLEAGGTLPDPLWDEFWTDVQHATPLMEAVRTVQVVSRKTRIPSLNIGERHRRNQNEGEWNENEAEFSTDHISISTEKGTVAWDLPQELVDENPEGTALADKILGQMTDAWSADTEDLGANGDMDSADGFENQNDGWITIADGEMDTKDAEGDVLNNDTIIQTIAQLDSKYRQRMSPALVVSSDQLLSYHYSLVDRETPLGDNVILGEADVNPFDFPIIGSGLWPDDTALFTDPQNLIYALNRDLEVEVLTESDKVSERDLFGRYFMRGDDDFAIENMDAGVLVENLGDPLTYLEEETT